MRLINPFSQLTNLRNRARLSMLATVDMIVFNYGSSILQLSNHVLFRLVTHIILKSSEYTHFPITALDFLLWGGLGYVSVGYRLASTTLHICPLTMLWVELSTSWKHKWVSIGWVIYGSILHNHPIDVINGCNMSILSSLPSKCL